jgi:stage III sporulation protein AB
MERSGLTVSDAWSSSIEQLKEVLSLQREDLDILQRFGDQLGSSDKEGQIKFIKLTLMQLHEEESKARELREKYERMYHSLGLLAGIALAIILL